MYRLEGRPNVDVVLDDIDWRGLPTLHEIRIAPGHAATVSLDHVATVPLAHQPGMHRSIDPGVVIVDGTPHWVPAGADLAEATAVSPEGVVASWSPSSVHVYAMMPGVVGHEPPTREEVDITGLITRLVTTAGHLEIVEGSVCLQRWFLEEGATLFVSSGARCEVGTLVASWPSQSNLQWTAPKIPQSPKERLRQWSQRTGNVVSTRGWGELIKLLGDGPDVLWQELSETLRSSLQEIAQRPHRVEWAILSGRTLGGDVERRAHSRSYMRFMRGLFRIRQLAVNR
ncbi:MAG: hypothetical protein KTR31_14265 [Myxococcales bacterium]|nr:hypothetical protein [Myxococcales bacterium]